MRNSPFAIFRRNQRQFMVVLTGLSMFAFIFLDAATTRGSVQNSGAFGAVLIALICAAGLWVIGSPRGKGSEWALWGALIGAVVGFVGFRSSSSADTVARTNVGTFHRSDMQLAAQRRSLANRFVAVASQGRSGGFGGTDDRSLVIRSLLLREARQTGVALSDDAVSEFINQISKDRMDLKTRKPLGALKRSEFDEILKDELAISEGDLYDLLREELEAQTVAKLSFPSRARMRSSFLPPGSVQTPLEYWSHFRKLELKQSLTTAAVPVSLFLAQVPAPTESAVSSFYEAHKLRLPSADGRHGFLRDRTVQLAYIAADFEAFEKQVTEPEDAEIEAYYEANKANYIVKPIPDKPASPSDNDPLSPEFEGEDGPVSASEPSNVELVPPAPTEPPATPSQPESKTESKPEEGGDGELQVALVEGQDTPAAPAKDEVKEEAAATKPEESSPASTPEAASAPKTPVSPLLLPELPPLPGTPGGPPAYRELDDELKAEIKETMIRERTLEKMAAAADGAAEFMTALSQKYIDAQAEPDRDKTGKAIKKAVAEISEKLKEYAQEQGLEYKETKPLTFSELRMETEEPIGIAESPTKDEFSRGTPVFQEAFSTDSVYFVHRAEGFRNAKSYAYWKIADTAPRVPDLKEVHQQVVDAWTLEQARPLAQKRAEALAAMVRQAGKPLAEALEGQTITGPAESQPLAIRDTPNFSWLEVPSSLPPMGLDPDSFQPRLSLIAGVNEPGEDFMRCVFDELQPGQVGVSLNQPRDVYYVVQVRQRDAAPTTTGENLGLQALQQQFLRQGEGQFFNPAFFTLSSDSQMQLEQNWRLGLEKRYAIEWGNDPEASAAR